MYLILAPVVIYSIIEDDKKATIPFKLSPEVGFQFLTNNQKFAQLRAFRTQTKKISVERNTIGHKFMHCSVKWNKKYTASFQGMAINNFLSTISIVIMLCT